MSTHGESRNVAAPQQDGDDSAGKPYEIIRLGDPIDTLLKLESDLGIMSNILMAASYRHDNNKPLTSDILFAALRLVIERYPSLSVLGFSQPSPKESGNHHTYLGRLKRIDLEACTSFIDNYDDSELGMQALYKSSHNDWFDMKDHTRPLWRLIVVNHIHVVFVWQHLVCDGRGGVAFHKSLLNALNEVSRGEDSLTNNPNNIVTTSTKPFPINVATQFHGCGYTSNPIKFIPKLLGLVLFRSWYGPRKFFFNDATYSKNIPVLGQVKKEDLCVTAIQSVKLDAALLKKCLVACKKNQTTFTSLLMTVLDIILATDIYPQSKVRLHNRLVDLRRYLPQDDDMINLAIGIGKVSKVEQFREANNQLLLHNPSVFWDLAREDTRWLQGYLNDDRKTPRPIEETMILTPLTEERFASRFLPSIGKVTDGAYSLSNLGAVDGKTGMRGDEPWNLSAIEFSCCATKTSVGSLLYIAVVSLKGGDCSINVSYEEGVLPDETVLRLVEGLKLRLIDMFQD